MKHLFVVLVFFSVGLPVSFLHAEKQMYKNPILPGFHPDPSLCRVGRDYYLVNSTFEYFPALPVYHSRDLVNWKQIGNVLDRDDQLDLSKIKSSVQGLYAPTIRHHDGVFYTTCAVVGGKGAFIVTTRDPAGPWGMPVWLNDYQIDSDLFWDDDGRLYYTACEGGEDGGVAQVELDPHTFKRLGEFRQIWENPDEPWDEGPHIYKVKGRYYLLAAVGGTGDLHLEQVAVSDRPWGPFSDALNSFLTHRDRKGHPIQATGHADMFQAHDGSWWTVFLGTRPVNGYTALGRETFLAPVTWSADGWPVAGEKNRVELEMPAANFMEKTPAGFNFRDNFDGKDLSLGWLYVRNPPAGRIRVDKRAGRLQLLGTAASPGEIAPQAWVGRRILDHQFIGTTLLEFSPERDGEEAGLCLRASDENRFEIALVRVDGEKRILCRSTLDGQAALLASEPVVGEKIHLRIGGDTKQFQAAWSSDGKIWNHLAAVEADKLRYVFTGLVMGLYANGNGELSRETANFDRLEIRHAESLPKKEISPRPTPTPLPVRQSWRVMAGGKGMVDHLGRRWLADQGWQGGTEAESSRPVGGTEDSALYQVERYGEDFYYRLSVNPGSWRVTLHFAETWVEKPGERVFDVFLNGKKVLESFDILKEAGARDRAVLKSFGGIEVGTAGQVEIRFKARVQNAKVSGIEIERELTP